MTLPNAIPPDESLESLPVFDKAEALEVVEGDEDFLKDLAAELLLQTPKALESMRRAAATGDLELAERVAHTLKSMAAHLGALRLSQLSARLEELAKRKELAAYAEGLSAVETGMQMLGEAFRREGVVK